MITLKIKYRCEELGSLVLKYQRHYSTCLHFMFNRISDNPSISETDLRLYHKNNLINNIDLLDSWFIQSSIKEAKSIYNSAKAHTNESKDIKVIFGGKKLFNKRCKNKISKEKFQLKRLSPIYSIGESNNKCIKVNRKFQLSQDLSSITFQPNRKDHYTLELIGVENRIHYLKKLYQLQETHALAITYKLDSEYVYISFDEGELYNLDYGKVNNRVMSIDLNPNSIGWSIVDWYSESEFKVIKSGVFNLYKLNKQHNTNKKHHELREISKKLINIAIYYKVQIFAIEDLEVKSKDHGKGKVFNRVVNNKWIRNEIINNITKRCNIFGIKLLMVKPEYSSFIGNFLYRSLNLQLPDMCLSSIEIGRRAYEFYNQYITCTKEIKKNIVFPDLNQFKYLYAKSLEEFGIVKVFKRVIDLYKFFKNPNDVRIPLKTKGLKVFCTDKSYVRQIFYI